MHQATYIALHFQRCLQCIIMIHSALWCYIWLSREICNLLCRRLS